MKKSCWLNSNFKVAMWLRGGILRGIQYRSGFTLIELMVTIAVIAIITTLAAPSFNKIMANQKLNASARELTNVLNQARAHATLIHQDVTVKLNSNATNTHTVFNWAPQDTTYLSNGITTLVFQSDGSISSISSDSDFSVCSSVLKLSKNISVSKMGTTFFKADGACS